MDNFNLDQNFIPDFSYLQALEEASSQSSGAIGSQPCMSGFSVQTLKSPLPNYVSQSDAVQNNAYSVNPLNQYVAASTSVSNFISTYNLVNFPLDELDVYLGTKETASDELISTEQNPTTDTSTPLHGASCGKTSVNFSQSSLRPVAIFNPQQEAQTEAESDSTQLTFSKGKAAKIRAQATKSDQPPARKSARARAQAKYDKSPAGKAARANYNQSPGGKAARIRSQDKYNQSPAGKAARDKYNQSSAGKAARAKYEKSPAGRAARARARAIRSARKCAYNIELASSGNKEIAKRKGEEAAEIKRSLLQNKSVDQIAPLFSRQTEGIYTVPIEPISP